MNKDGHPRAIVNVRARSFAESLYLQFSTVRIFRPLPFIATRQSLPQHTAGRVCSYKILLVIETSIMNSIFSMIFRYKT